MKLDEKVPGLDAFLAEPGVVRDRRFADMIKIARPQSWRSLYAMIYLTRGSLVHGNEHAIGDVLQSVTLPGETQSRSVLAHGAGLEGVNAVLGEIIQNIVEMIVVFGAVLGNNEPHRRIQEKQKSQQSTKQK
jgi:tryptophan synthase beta subunit